MRTPTHYRVFRRTTASQNFPRVSFGEELVQCWDRNATHLQVLDRLRSYFARVPWVSLMCASAKVTLAPRLRMAGYSSSLGTFSYLLGGQRMRPSGACGLASLRTYSI